MNTIKLKKIVLTLIGLHSISEPGQTAPIKLIKLIKMKSKFHSKITCMFQGENIYRVNPNQTLTLNNEWASYLIILMIKTKQIPAARSSDFVNQSYYYRPNWNPLSPIAIMNLAHSELRTKSLRLAFFSPPEAKFA